MKRLPLTRGKFALVDDEDFKSVSRFKWKCNKARGLSDWYACRSILDGTGWHTIYLARFLANAPNGMLVSFKNGNRLDCRKQNLCFRTVTQIAWGRNRNKNTCSNIKGVTRHHNNWRARILLNGRLVILGEFATVEKTDEAYKQASLKYHGEFSYLHKNYRKNRELGDL